LPVGRSALTIVGMPRGARATQGGYCYHVLNRDNARRTVFHKEGDFEAFVKSSCSARPRNAWTCGCWPIA
jgi:hypothetical protein